MLIQLAFTGLLVALLPLAIVWASSDTDKYRKLVWVTLFLTFDLIMFGAFTRLTDSGLGCPDWPGCYGHANPLAAHEHISAAQAALPSGPVTVMKAWIEMIHRYLAMAVGVLIIALTVIEWWRWLHPKCISAFSHVVSAWRNSLHSMMNRLCSLSAALVMALRSLLLSIWIGLPSAPWYLAFLLAFVCLQGAFGAWTVTMKLQPVIVTTHLLLGMGLLGLLAWLAARQTNRPSIQSAAVALRIPAVLALIVLAIQIALGGWVSTNYAALACTEFPLCQGAWLPSMDFSNGFTLWRHLGKTGSGDYLPFPALVAIHWIHRLFAFAVIGLVGIVAHRALKIAELHKIARGLLIMLAVQFITGVSTVFFDWPLALAVAHNGGAALLVLLLTMLNYRISSTANNRVESRDTTLSTA